MSFIVKYKAKPGCYLIGGVKESESSKWQLKSDAVTYAANLLNLQAEHMETPEIVEVDEPPDIFVHCPGYPSQAVGGCCFNCKKKLTELDAAACGRHRLVVRIQRGFEFTKDAVVDKIKSLDPTSKLDPESNPVTLWITTDVPRSYIEMIPGVEDVVISVEDRKKEKRS